MNDWLIVLVLTGLSVGIQDIAHTAGIAFVAHDQRGLATTTEGIEALLIVASVVLAGDSLLQFGAFAFVTSLAVVFLSAKIGAEIGFRLSIWLEGRYHREVHHRLKRPLVPHG